MQKITPHLWFDKEAIEAANFYVKVFPGSTIKDTVVLHNTPSGSVDVINIQIWGYNFQMINAGPPFKFTTAVSFHAACRTEKEVDEAWKNLSEGGIIMMELGEYPFSKKYGWVQDKYGISWQVGLMDGSSKQRITPNMMFTEGVCGKAEEAVNYYTSVFKNSKIGELMMYQEGEDPNEEGTVKFVSFTLEGQEFAAMDSALMHGFTFNEAISFIVYCKDQEEIDYYWDRLSADPNAEQCGWLKDKYGFSWQIVPEQMENMMKDKDEKKIARVTEAFLKMKKFDLKKLEEAYEKA